jgi:metallo-beta-lactamase family protein
LRQAFDWRKPDASKLFSAATFSLAVTMRITHHGAYKGVTGSCHELHYADKRSVLIDCGMFQGEDAKDHPGPEIDFPLDDVDALLLTHVHIDHIGRIPYLLQTGFNKPIYCTRPTAKLLPLMLEDAIKLGITRRERVVSGILSDLGRLIRPVAYDQWEKMDGGLRFRFQPAGHVLGSAYIEIEMGDERYVFSGDLGSRQTPILAEPVSPERADLLVLESTYGDRNHEGREERINNLEAILCHTLANKGITIIPAFSLGRTQELLYEMNHIFENIEKRQCVHLLRQVDVIVDSPLSNRLTDIYNEMQEYWDEDAQELMRIDKQPLVFENLFEIDKHGMHQGSIDYLKKHRRPAVVIAGSGMCTGGRVLDWLKNFIGNPTTDVVFIGYQAYGTLGRVIQDGADTVRIDGRSFPVKARVHSLSGYSAHADQSDLLRFVQGIKQPPKEIRLVHGETKAKEALGEKLAALGFKVS